MSQQPAGAAKVAGARLSALTPGEREAAVSTAFAYRGDVTLELDGAEPLSGYVFARQGEGEGAAVLMLTSDGGRTSVLLSRLTAVVLSGPDKAAGRSWQAWVARYEEKKRLAALGISTPSIEPEPEPLD